ncbi:sodium:solute symporter [Mycolicibacterium agri]|uniref:Sodium:solute symporter n=1 Tax=Mycolicibacterium agri TaxID=36811 RepID=A0A2A7MV35_MYCAG|nr:sodium:solute symporter family protein [Mycolicibacterium agri]PEG35420.1 sodium:solute symporter [Mycolicibacterium agri]GFG55543.1 sodium:solute symporter [Mycolicibacterium agri]
MQMLIGYGGVAVFLAILFVILQRTRTSADFSEYATAGRSFGPMFSAMAFVNTWLPGTIFIAFAGLAASAGAIGFYFVSYSILAVVLMFLLAQPVHEWGRRFDLRTQADLLRLRYGSTAVRVIAAVIGVIASFPWIVLGMQSLTLVFEYLSFGAVSAGTAAFIGIAVIVVRQWWTVRLGARGLVIGDFIQGVVAYLIGTLLILGLITWLITNGHGFGEVDPAFLTLPGPGSADGPLFLFALVATGALGGWCWPDIFVRLFTSDSTHTIKRAAVMASPLLFVFGSALCLLAMAASTLPGVSDAPDQVWFITASVGGPLILTLAGLCVLAATMGNVGANLQALGAQIANDVVGVARGTRVEDARWGKVSVGVLTLVAGAVAVATTDALASGMVALAQVSYQGIVQLAPTLFLGIFWRRGNAAAACAAMIVGFATACVLQLMYPIAIPVLGGLTSGVVALAVNFVVYVAVSYAAPATPDERRRVAELFDSLHQRPADLVDAKGQPR